MIVRYAWFGGSVVWGYGWFGDMDGSLITMIWMF